MIIEKPLNIQEFLRGADSVGSALSVLKRKPYKLSINVGPDRRRFCFKYNQIKSDMSAPICQEARGLILDREDNWNVVSYAFSKFFNAAQNLAVDIDWDSAEVFEKLDGSCANLYYWQDEWKMHTLGTVEGEGEVQMADSLMKRKDWSGETFSDLFWHTFEKIYGLGKLEELDKSCCYVTELCTSYNRVVKRYDEDRIVLLGIRNRKSLQERDISTAPDWWDRPNRFEVSEYGEIMDAVETLDPDDEGFVCVDKHWRRIKIKQESYVLRHRMKNSVTQRKNGIVEAILKEEADDFVGAFPEFKDVFEETKAEMEDLVGEMEEYYHEIGGSKTDPDNHEERKSFALNVQNFEPGEVQGLFFQRLTGKIEDFWDGLKEMQPSKVSNALDKSE